MMDLKINFEQIQQRVDAARALQEADQTDDSRDILLKLANDILSKIPEKNHEK